MHQRKNKKILYYLFLFIIVTSINNNSLKNFDLKTVKNINVSGLNEKDNKILLEKIKNLKIENIFSINEKKIKKLISSNPIIEKYEVFKKYPFGIDVRLEKTNFYAKINKNGQSFLVGSNGKLSPIKLYIEDLPFIFGKPEVKEFLEFKKIIDNSKFTYDQIKNFYFFQSKRWDLKTKKNILIKLPKNVDQNFLNDLYKFIKHKNFEKFTIIDARVKNQIILNE